MRLHFWNRHVWDTVVILEEGNLPYPWCHLCDMLFLWRSLNGVHLRIAQCKRGADSN